jgi:diguanylate cyclase (GGDEF)-like protein
MLAFRAGVPVTLDPVLTIGSLVVAVTGTFIGISLAASRPTAVRGIIGGGIFGAAISCMHYMGMAAYRVDGIVTWNQSYVITSVFCALVFGAAAFSTLRRDAPGWRRIGLATGLIVAAIATLHFIAMTAMDIAPLTLSDTPLQPDDWRALGFATAFVGAIVIGAAVFAAAIDRQTRSETMRKLAHMASNDALTGLPNRAGFRAELVQRIERAAQSGTQLALSVINLKRFKEINDLHGHKAGDDVLAQFAERLRAALDPNDVVGRLGGDEFVVLGEIGDRHEASEFVAQIEAALGVPLRIGRGETRLAASVGVALFPSDAATAELLANNAEIAMHRAKADQAVGACYYDAELDQAIRDRRELAADLGHAIERNELDVHYQVQTKARTGEVTGYEALLRWTHPVRGAVPPSIFIPVAEENGLILALGEWVLRRACADAAKWENGAKVAVNVSPLQLVQTDLPALVHQVMLETGLPPKQLEVELTESAIMADQDRALHVLRQLKALGVGVALDDFGTGYSSLATLRSFPFDKIKLDGLFTFELEGSAQATAIVRAVLAMGKSLAIPVLAEGVETAQQLQILMREGCEEIQGFLIGRPAPVSAILANGTPAGEMRISDAA